MAQTFFVSRQVYGNQEDALISITNKEESDLRRYFEIKEIIIEPAAISGTDSRLLLRRFNVAEGLFTLGIPTDQESSTFGEITPIKVKSDSPNLPSGVRIYKNCERNLSPISIQTLRQIYAAQFSAIGAGALSNIGYRTMLGKLLTYDRGNSGHIYKGDNNFGNVVEKYTIREREAFIIERADNTNPGRACTWYINVSLTCNGSTYIINDVICDNGQRVIFGIANSFTGNPNITINSIHLFDIGPFVTTDETQNSPKLRIVSTKGDNGGGDLITANPIVSSNTVPTALEIRINNITGTILRPNYNVNGGNELLQSLGYPITNGPFIKSIGTYRNSYPIPRETRIGVNSFFNSKLYSKEGVYGFKTQKEGLIIRPGEGIAVVCSNFSAYNSFYIHVKLLHIPPPASGGNYGYGYI